MKLNNREKNMKTLRALTVIALLIASVVTVMTAATTANTKNTNNKTPILAENTGVVTTKNGTYKLTVRYVFKDQHITTSYGDVTVQYRDQDGNPIEFREPDVFEADCASEAHSFSFPSPRTTGWQP